MVDVSSMRLAKFDPMKWKASEVGSSLHHGCVVCGSETIAYAVFQGEWCYVNICLVPSNTPPFPMLALYCPDHCPVTEDGKLKRESRF